MTNYAPRRLLCIDTKNRIVRRYLDRKCVQAKTLKYTNPAAAVYEIEAYRMYGVQGIAYTPGDILA